MEKNNTATAPTMQEFDVEVDGQSYIVQAESEDQLPAIVSSISNSQRRNKIEDFSTGAMNMMGKAMDMRLVPEQLSSIGRGIESATPEALRPGLDMATETMKGMAFPGMGMLSKEMVDRPVPTLMGMSAALPVIAAGKIGGPIMALNALKPLVGSVVGGSTGSVVGGKIADFVFGEGEYTNTGSLVGGLLLGAVGGAVGKGMQVSPQKAQYYKDMVAYKQLKNTKQVANKVMNEAGGKDLFKQAIANSSDDLVAKIKDVDAPLTEAYSNLDSKHYNKMTNITAEDIANSIPDQFKDEILPASKRISRVERGTSGVILDAKGKTIPRKVTFREAFNIKQDLRKVIDRRLYNQESATDLLKIEEFIDTQLNRVRGPVDRLARKALNAQYEVIRPAKQKLLKAMGYDWNTGAVDTTKLDRIISDKGDISVKNFMQTMANLDDSIKTGMDTYRMSMETLKQAITDLPPMPTRPPKTSGIGKQLLSGAVGAGAVAGANAIKRAVDLK